MIQMKDDNGMGYIVAVSVPPGQVEETPSKEDIRIMPYRKYIKSAKGK